MGPNEVIDSICWETNGPMQSHRQEWVHIPMGPCKTIGSSSCMSQWAQTKLSTAPVGKLMGPCKAIGSSNSIFRWAHAKLSAAAGAYANGPTQNHQQQQLLISMGPNKAIGISSWMREWAHAKLLTAAGAYANGPTQ